MAPTINIERRFCGPSDSGNGGYTAGLLAAMLSGEVEVTLSRPLPLDRPLGVAAENSTIVLLDGDETLATAVRSDAQLPAPPALVSVADARAAAEQCAIVLNPDWHPAPQCFVCGNERVAGDGLRIFPGPVAPGHYAAPWTPGADLAAAGVVRPEFVWAALDCPSSFLIYDPPGTRPEGFYVLGRMTARLDGDVRASEEYVVQSWLLAREGRKLQSASAVCRADGAALAIARATWIRI
jgi:hypothetical protein